MLKHWFAIVMSLLVIAFIIFFTLVLIAPKHDADSRGFVACTDSLKDDLINCEDKVVCVLGSIFRNSYCDAKIIGKGFSLWIQGRQEKPWSNYLFEPKLAEDESLEYYDKPANIKTEMHELKKLNEELSNEQE